jgi:hypothetical protein
MEHVQEASKYIKEKQMELIRINDDHYIIVDGISKEIGEYVYDDDYDKPLIYKTDKDFFDIGKEAFVITHSTVPLEDGEFDKIQPISIQEVEKTLYWESVHDDYFEMVTGEKVEDHVDERGRWECEFVGGELKLIL